MKFVNIFGLFVVLVGTASAIKFPIVSSVIPDCPADEPLALFPHDNDCSKFYYCTHGTISVHDCPEGLHFNPNELVCDYPELAGCEDRTTVATDEPSTTEESSTPACRSSDIYLGSHETDCSKFYAYISGDQFSLQCKFGKEFDHSAQNCVKISSNGCTAMKIKSLLRN